MSDADPKGIREQDERYSLIPAISGGGRPLSSPLFKIFAYTKKFIRRRLLGRRQWKMLQCRDKLLVSVVEKNVVVQ